MLRADAELGTSEKNFFERLSDRFLKRWFQLRLEHYNEQQSTEEQDSK
jgi:hypothetical protein